MRTFAVAAASIIAVLLGLAVLATGAAYLVSHHIRGTPYEIRAERLVQPSATELADAGRQARILGCISCHGERLQGLSMVDAPPVVRLNAPNLPLLAASATDQQLAQSIRQGIGADGRALLFMPSPQYSRLADGEVAALIAYIRSLPIDPRQVAAPRFGPIGHFLIATGKFRMAPVKVAEFNERPPADMGTATARGRYLAGSRCSDCHGRALEGREMEDGHVTPDLAIAGAYDLDQFKTLLRTGKASGGRELPMMSDIARKDFAVMNDEEIASLHAYLRARAEAMPAQ